MNKLVGIIIMILAAPFTAFWWVVWHLIPKLVLVGILTGTMMLVPYLMLGDTVTDQFYLLCWGVLSVAGIIIGAIKE